MKRVMKKSLELGVDIFYAGLGGGGDCKFPENFSVPPQVDQKKIVPPQND